MSRRKSLHSSKSNGDMSIGSEEGWDAEQTKELLSKMKQAIPQPDVSKYKTLLEKFDWGKVNIGKFTEDECKKQWDRIYKKLRKFKTLSDLIADSMEYLENPYKGCVKKHPDHPKRPLTPYFRFFLSEREKYAATHKNLSNLEITSILSKKYREITIREKEKYMEEWKSEMVEYRKKMEQFKKEHPEYYDKSPPRPSRTPLQIFNQENMATMSSRSKKKMSKKEMTESLKSKYHNLEDDQKLPYIMKAIEEWEKYKEELEMYKKSHPNFVPTAIHKKSVLTINDWRIHDKSLGRPNRPPANGYNLFCTRMMVSDSMKHLTSRDRIMECGQRWKLLSDSEKAAYQKEFISLRENYRAATKNFLKGLTPRQREEYLDRKRDFDTKKNQKRKNPVKIKEEAVSEEASTSSEGDEENMEVNDSSSDGSSSSEESSDEEEEEEVEEEEIKENKKKESTVGSPPTAPIRPTTPISALFLYQKAHREKFARKHPGVSKSDITIMLARRFNNLPREKKLKYNQKEKEQRALYTEQMRKHVMGEIKNALAESQTPELRAITGEQVFHDQNRENYMKKCNGNAQKAGETMRRAWTHMNKERRKKFITIAHEQNAKNIAEREAAAKNAEKEATAKASRPAIPERNLKPKEIKSYLALEPKKVPRDSLCLFKKEYRPKLQHLLPNARNQELNRIWSEMTTSDKNKYKQRAKVGLTEYNKKLQRWIKSLPPQALEVYKTSAAKKSRTTAKEDKKEVVSNGTGKKRKADAKAGKGEKKKKIAKVQSIEQDSEESSDDSSDDEEVEESSSSSSSDDSDDDSDTSSDSDSSSSDSDSSESEGEKAPAKTAGSDSSGDSSSSSGDEEGESDSD